MRHRHGLRKLNRTSAHRQAMLRNMMNSLIELVDRPDAVVESSDLQEAKE